jgi:hypothetical protein
VHSAGALGSLPAQQLVLRAACHGEAKVSWQVERMPPGCLPQHAAPEAAAVARSLGERLALAATAGEKTPDALATADPDPCCDQRGPDEPEAQPDPQA